MPTRQRGGYVEGNLCAIEFSDFVIVNPVAIPAINTRDIRLPANLLQITAGTVWQSHTLRHHDLLSLYRLSSIYDRLLTHVGQWDCLSLAEALTFSH